ncbi:MAG: hypothetical protein K8R76_04435 [Candidatus Aegiribacteria sp.]|nr:hypothetical protein [Candidatus Aegiribacteria sp.]
MKISVLLTIVLFLTITLNGCGSEESNASQAESIEPCEPITVILPGNVMEPAGDTVSVPDSTSVMLYYWVPLEKFEAMEKDLLFLSSVDPTILVLPVQPDQESRNHAQRVVNSLEISLPVYLADSTLMEVFEGSILPMTVLFTPEGDLFTAEGFGAPLRLLEKHQTGI